MKLSAEVTRGFQKQVLAYYRTHGRHDLPWRCPEPDGSFDPYKILVSEIMLQQTQVGRVIPKYCEFLQRFPNVPALAEAPLGEVIRAWSGLGYNRRAKYLWQAVRHIAVEHDGCVPSSNAELVKLPGIGKNTAGAIMVYAYNQPAVFVETNIRTVFIHHFFGDESAISDKDIVALVEQTLDARNPRQFYWGLMDYGTHLKSTIGNLNKLSVSYGRQTTFAGSKRQLRGQVLRALGQGPRKADELGVRDERLPAVLQELLAEGMIQQHHGCYSL